MLQQVREVRSLLPETVKVLSLTATTTKTLREKVSEVIGLVVIVCPCKLNLIYSVRCFTSLEEIFAAPLQDLIRLRLAFPRSIVYCWTYAMCNRLYRLFKRKMRGYFTEPPNSPTTVSKLRLVEMCVDEEVKSQIISSFTSTDDNTVTKA